MSVEDDKTVEAFLIDRCDITGRADDQVRASVLLVAYQDWAADMRQPPLPDRSFYRVLRTLAGAWAHPLSGHRFSGVKSSVSTYRGLRMRAVA